MSEAKARLAAMIASVFGAICIPILMIAFAVLTFIVCLVAAVVAPFVNSDTWDKSLGRDHD